MCFRQQMFWEKNTKLKGWSAASHLSWITILCFNEKQTNKQTNRKRFRDHFGDTFDFE